VTDGGWLRVARTDSLAFDPGAVVHFGGLELALFRLADGTLCAVDESCPHAGASLAGGELEGALLTCPWHGFRFDLRTGRCEFPDDLALRTYEVREVEGWIEIRVAGRVGGG
jgi:3-phenylpropionate/trans-cinnamate dioxygenase ferredoxin subunit